MSIKQGPRAAGMRTTANGFGRRHLAACFRDVRSEAAQ
jgi:hypothetical protein